jgi:hypothetical protein
MNQAIFERMWDDVHALFGVSAPKDARRTICRTKTEHIPDEAARWICDQFEQMESKPRNMVLEIKRLWQRWQEDNPRRIARIEHRCPYCIPGYPGSLLVLRYYEDMQRWEECVLPCGHCQREGWQDWQIKKMGWHHLPMGIVPQHLEHLIYINRSEAEVVFRNGAPFHDLVRSGRFNVGEQGAA